jgi:hypothetical protein
VLPVFLKCFTGVVGGKNLAKYEQIQTYARYINKENFQRVLQSYRQLLLQIGLSNYDVNKWISGITRSVDDFGINYIETNYISHNMILEMDLCRMNVCVSILIWTNETISYLKEPWVEILLRIKPEEQINEEYESELENIIWEIMSIISGEFQETGVYGTNEMQDGEAFIGLAANLKEKLWAFNRAIIPHHHHLHYQNMPEDFKRYAVSHGLGYLRKTV